MQNYINAKQLKLPMEMKSNTLMFLKVFIAVTLPVSLLLATILYQAFDEPYYHEQFRKGNVYESLQGKDADALLKGLLAYFKGNDNALDSKAFTQREISHLYDVRGLINTAKTVLLMLAFLQAAAVISVIALSKKKFLSELKGPAIIGAGISLTTALMLLLFSLNFSYLFLVFHRFFFLGDTFLFPASSTLILMFPESFFQHIFLRAVLPARIDNDSTRLSGANSR